jgi:hypothetical protein
MNNGAHIALDIPTPKWPESSIEHRGEETCSRAYLNERNEAAPAPKGQVRPHALLYAICDAAGESRLASCLVPGQDV